MAILAKFAAFWEVTAAVFAIPFFFIFFGILPEFRRLDVDAATLGTHAVEVLVVDGVIPPRHSPPGSLLGLLLGDLERLLSRRHLVRIQLLGGAARRGSRPRSRVPHG